MARGNRGKPGTPRSWIWLVAALCLFGMWQLLEREAGPGMPPIADTQPAPDTGPGAARDTAATPQQARGDTGIRMDPALAFLPPEAHATLALIDRGGPFPHRQDGTTFQNRERLLPAKPRGYYREYTVPTPGSRDRGARRIVAGGNPPEVFYYTADHYSSFRQIEPLP